MRAAIVIVAFLLSAAPVAQKKTKVKPPIIKLFSSSAYSISHCPFSLSLCPRESRHLKLNTAVEDAGPVKYAYTVSAGRIEGTGPLVIWNLDDIPFGEYDAKVSVTNAKKGLATATLKVKIVECGVCDPPPPLCPTITVECPSEVEKGKPITFTVNIKGDPSLDPLLDDVSYEWFTSSGKIVKGQSERKMTLEPSGFPFETITVTVSVRGFDPSCTGTQASCTISIKSDR